MRTSYSKLVEDQSRYWIQIQRGIAFLIDVTVAFSPFIILKNIFNYEGYIYFLAFPLALTYFSYLEYKYGQTLGKKLLGICVLMENGSSLTMSASLIRNIARLIDNIPFIGWASLVTMLITSKKQRIGDMLANTIVIRI